MIALSHLLLCGIMVGVACEAPVGRWMLAAGAVAAYSFAMFIVTAPKGPIVADVSPYESID